MAKLNKTSKSLKVLSIIYFIFNFIIFAAFFALCFGTSLHNQLFSSSWIFLSIPALGMFCAHWIYNRKLNGIKTLLLAVSLICSVAILYIAFVTAPQMDKLKEKKFQKSQAQQQHPLNQETERMFLGLYAGDVEIVKVQLSKGVDVNVRNETQQTPLHVTQNATIAKLLIENGADLSAENDLGDTPIFNKEIQIAEILLDAGADINLKNRKNNTLLIRYTYAGYLEGIKFLVSKGADINTCNSDRQNALDIVKHFHPNSDTLRYLQSLNIHNCP